MARAAPSRRTFASVAGQPETDVDLAEASLLIACEEYPDLDVTDYLARLDAMALEVRARTAGTGTVASTVAALNAYLFGEQGFHGNEDDYYDPRNSYLNEVMDRRTGIPISLSALYVEVARRAGIEAVGVGLPGHFIVRVARGPEHLLVDPFHGGDALSNEDCQRRLDRIFAGRVRLEPHMFTPCETKAVLSRMLRNLKAIYTKTEDYPRALRVLDLLLALRPDADEDLRDRGLVYAALDCYALAADDLETYLTRVPASAERPALLARVATLRQRAARLN